MNYEPLRELKQRLLDFPQQDTQGRQCPLWRLPNLSTTRNLETLNYVVTTSQKEWEDQILTLAQIIVEGLNTRFINKVAETLNCRDEQLGSIKQLSRILETIGIPVLQRSSIIEPFVELQKLRSSGIAHVGNARVEQDLIIHFRRMIERCDYAMTRLAELIQSGVFPVI